MYIQNLNPERALEQANACLRIAQEIARGNASLVPDGQRLLRQLGSANSFRDTRDAVLDGYPELLPLNGKPISTGPDRPTEGCDVSDSSVEEIDGGPHTDSPLRVERPRSDGNGRPSAPRPRRHRRRRTGSIL